MGYKIHPSLLEYYTMYCSGRYWKGSCLFGFVILEKYYLQTMDFIMQLLTYKQAGFLTPK